MGKKTDGIPEVSGLPSWLFVTAGTVTILILLAAFALYSTGRDGTKQSDLGIGLLTGSVVGFAILAAELIVDRRDQHLSDHLAQGDRRRTLMLTLSISQDLRGSDLRRLELDGAYLRGKDLSGSNLAGASLRGADLTGTDLSGAVLVGTDLSGARIAGATFVDAIMYGANLRGASALLATTPVRREEQGSLSPVTVADDQLRWIATRAGYVGELDDVRSWLASTLDQRADFAGAKALGANFTDAQLVGARFERADLSGARLDGADLSLSDLSGARVRREVIGDRAKRVQRTLDQFPLPEELDFHATLEPTGELLGIRLPRPSWVEVRLDGAVLAGTEFSPDADLRPHPRASVVVTPATSWPGKGPPEGLKVVVIGESPLSVGGHIGDA